MQPSLLKHVIIEAQERQLTIIGQAVDQALEVNISPLQEVQKTLTLYTEPIRQTQKILEAMVEPIRRTQEIINSLPVMQFMNIAKEVTESQRRTAEIINTSVLTSISHIKPINPFLGIIQVGEIIEHKTQQESLSINNNVQINDQRAIVIPPHVLPILVPPKSSRSKMGLKQISGGNFSYKRVTLKGISLRNKEGQALGLMLTNPDLFISDETMQEKLFAKDIFDQSKIIQLLKNKFKRNGLQAVIERQGNGYILIAINYLQ